MFIIIFPSFLDFFPAEKCRGYTVFLFHAIHPVTYLLSEKLCDFSVCCTLMFDVSLPT